MAPVGGEALGSLLVSSGSFSPDFGVFSLLLLVIISIFLTAVCSNCRRHSFELREPEVEKTPSALLKVVKLEPSMEARDNPMIKEILNDEMEKGLPAEAMQSSEDESGSWFVPWRNHLEHHKQQDINGTPRADREDFLSASPNLSSTTQGMQKSAPNLQPDSVTNEADNDLGPHSIGEEGMEGGTDPSWDPMYARVSRKVQRASQRFLPPADLTPEEEEQPSPPLPERCSDLE